jgi:hypothetical protein
MDRNEFFETLWQDFSHIAPQAAAIAARLASEGERVENDHVAFRTFDGPEVGLEILEPLVLSLGYERLDTYHFDEKHLRAHAYVRPNAPRIFVSELLRNELSDWSRQTLARLIAQIPKDFASHPGVFWAGRPWAPLSHSDYQRLSDESEYAGWLAALGFRANHFTVSINALTHIRDVESVLGFVERSGYRVNEAGGRVKGTPDVLLEQGSTLADRVAVDFADGSHVIPTCYYEFALRHPDATGKLYEGFVPASANRIFESTHRA